jgi:hypothetical protein
MSGYRLDIRGSIPGRGKGFFLYPLCPDRLWGPLSLLSSGYQWSLPRGKAWPGCDTNHCFYCTTASSWSYAYRDSFRTWKQITLKTMSCYIQGDLSGQWMLDGVLCVLEQLEYCGPYFLKFLSHMGVRQIFYVTLCHKITLFVCSLCNSVFSVT